MICLQPTTNIARTEHLYDIQYLKSLFITWIINITAIQKNLTGISTHCTAGSFSITTVSRSIQVKCSVSLNNAFLNNETFKFWLRV